MKLEADIDLDMADRNRLLSVISHVPAAIRKENSIKKHVTGIYVTDIPVDPVNKIAALDYKRAEERGYFKLDVLNMHLYSKIRDEQHLLELMREPDWNRFRNKQIFEQLVHVGNHYSVLEKMPEPVDSIARLSMFIALIRPGKRHLIGLPWKEVAKTIWNKTEDGYYFRSSHSCAYAHLVVVHCNLLSD